jgi:hypothetical protein
MANYKVLIVIISMFLTSCTSTFMGSVFVFTFTDIVYYVLIALAIAFLIGSYSNDNFKKNFLIWFILNLILTPLPGLIYLLIKMIGK